MQLPPGLSTKMRWIFEIRDLGPRVNFSDEVNVCKNRRQHYGLVLVNYSRTVFTI